MKKSILRTIPSGNGSAPRLFILCTCGRRYWTRQYRCDVLKTTHCKVCSPKKRGNQRKIRICDAAVLVLRETGNPAVMHGDDGLLHEIAERAKTRTKRWGPFLADYIIHALSRCPGPLVARFTKTRRNRRVRIFYLPEVAKERGIT